MGKDVWEKEKLTIVGIYAHKKVVTNIVRYHAPWNVPSYLNVINANVKKCVELVRTNIKNVRYQRRNVIVRNSINMYKKVVEGYATKKN